MKQYPKYKDSGVSWIGEIPEGWETLKLKFLCSYFQAGSNLTSFQIKPEGTYSVYGGNGIRGYFDEYNWDGGCNLIGRQGALCGNVHLVKDKFWATEHAIIIKANEKSSDDFLFYLMTAMNLNQYASQTAAQPGLAVDRIKQVKACCPPLPEQHAIVSYLDKKTAQIDRFISEATKEIEKLNELKQAQVAHLVTHGTNPDAPMKDSGIAWIGQIPEHWKKARYKDVLSIQDEKVGKRKDLTLLSLTKQGVIIRDLAEMKGKFPKDFESYKVVHPDNIILCLFDVDETPRTVGLSHNEGMITGAYDVFSIKNIDKEYFLYHYLSLDDRKAMKPLYKGLRKTIPLPRLMGEHIFIPPASEQKAIVSAINSLNNKIETLVSELTTQIDHLKELKQRIISDAVTGKIDVREVNN